HCQCAHKPRANPERPAAGCSTSSRRTASTSAATILRPRITRGSIISGPAPFNYARQVNSPLRWAQVPNDAVVLGGICAIVLGCKRSSSLKREDGLAHSRYLNLA